MKKSVCYVFAIAVAFLFASCGNGSSGTAMLDLDVRIVPAKNTVDVKEWLDGSNPEEKQIFEDFSNLFTVLPGPYEFTWEELKNQDGRVGYEQCATKLKIRLRLNKTLKPGNILNRYGHAKGREYIEEEMLKSVLSAYVFEMFNSEGKISMEVGKENDHEHYLLFLRPDLSNVWGADGRISFKENTDGIRDFYQFLTSAPGTEFDLILDCGIQLCKDIEDIIDYNKGLYIMPTSRILDGNLGVE